MRFLQARHDRTMRRNRELHCEDWIYHQICEARSPRRRVFRALCLRIVTRSRDRNFKPFYPQFLICRHVAVVNENVFCLRRLIIIIINNTNSNNFFNKNILFIIITKNIYKNCDKILKKSKNTLECLIKI